MVVSLLAGLSKNMTLQNILNLIVGIGIPSIVGGLVYIGIKIQVLNSLEKTIEKIKLNLKLVADTLIQSDIDFKSEKLQTYSPVRLTEEGRQYLEKVSFIKLFEDNKDDFINFIKEDNPKTDYDIENSAIRSVLALFDEGYFNPVKDYLYNNPSEGKKEFVGVAGIYVRDRYMERV